MKNKLLLSSLLLLANHITAHAQYNYYNSSQYRYNVATYNYNLYNSQINSYKPAGYGTYSYSTPSGSYGSYNYNSYTPSYNYNSYDSYTPSYNSYSAPSYNSSSSSSAVTTAYFASSKIIFAQSADDKVQPVGASTNFTLTANPHFLKIFVYNNNTAIKTDLLSIDVYKKIDGVDKFMEKAEYSGIGPTWTYFHISYDFAKFGAGDYRLDFFTSGNIYINTGYVTINLKNSENIKSNTQPAKSTVAATTTKTSALSDPSLRITAVTSSDYYKNSNIYFFENKEDFDLGGTGRNSLYLKIGSDVAYIEVTNDLRLNTSKLMVSIEKKDSRGTYQPYDKKEFSYDDLNSKSFYFTYNFKEVGDYRFDVKSKEGFWVNADYVSVYRK
jgi:hypothetical protein